MRCSVDCNQYAYQGSEEGIKMLRFLLSHCYRHLQLAYLPDKRRELAFDDDDELNHAGSELEQAADGNATGVDDSGREEKKTKRRGMLGWFKLRVSCKLIHVVALSLVMSEMLNPFLACVSAQRKYAHQPRK